MGLGYVSKYSLADGVRKAWQKFYPLILLWICYTFASVSCFQIFFFFFFGWEACRSQSPRPGIEPWSRPWKVKSQSLEAREIPAIVAASYFCKKRKDPCICVSFHVGLGKSRPALRIAPNTVEHKVTLCLFQLYGPEISEWEMESAAFDDGSCLFCPVDGPNLVTDLKISLYGQPRHYTFLILISILAFVF